jgi:hypothetical protein
MIIAFVTCLYLIFPALTGAVLRFIERNNVASSEALPILVTTLFWQIAIACGISAFNNIEHSKGFYAVAAAAITMSLTTYGEMFNSLPDEEKETKIRQAKRKSLITIFRALLIFVFTVWYFYSSGLLL